MVQRHWVADLSGISGGKLALMVEGPVNTGDELYCAIDIGKDAEDWVGCRLNEVADPSSGILSVLKPVEVSVSPDSRLDTQSEIENMGYQWRESSMADSGGRRYTVSVTRMMTDQWLPGSPNVMSWSGNREDCWRLALSHVKSERVDRKIAFV